MTLHNHRTILFIVFSGLLFWGCQNNRNMDIVPKAVNIIKYTYNGIVITRLDYYAKTEFYFGDTIRTNSPVIWAEYSGINDGFKGYLEFKKNGKVNLLSGDGYFQSKNIDTTLFQYRRIYAYNSPDDNPNVCEIMLSTRYEREFNSQSNTEVIFNYLKNKKK